MRRETYSINIERKTILLEECIHFLKLITSGKLSLEKTIRRQVLPHAPSPTITNFFRIAAILQHYLSIVMLEHIIDKFEYTV